MLVIPFLWTKVVHEPTQIASQVVLVIDHTLINRCLKSRAVLSKHPCELFQKESLDPQSQFLGIVDFAQQVPIALTAVLQTQVRMSHCHVHSSVETAVTLNHQAVEINYSQISPNLKANHFSIQTMPTGGIISKLTFCFWCQLQLSIPSALLGQLWNLTVTFGILGNSTYLREDGREDGGKGKTHMGRYSCLSYGKTHRVAASCTYRRCKGWPDVPLHTKHRLLRQWCQGLKPWARRQAIFPYAISPNRFLLIGTVDQDGHAK